MKTAPLLSIGMIFKNEARCLERCLKSLQPLRDAVPCELVMADTGAEDGSREIAEKYADEVFDFPWVNDFSAARNAVMDRCSGKWYLTIDSDEWLDADFSELVALLKSRKTVDYAFVVQRNYNTIELEQSGNYNDFHALRLMRMATGYRYFGTIHEAWPYQGPAEHLMHVVLHHDGYLFTDAEQQKKKMQRNMKLLRQKLETEPDNLRTLLQCIESGGRDADLIQYVRRAVTLVKDKRGDWERFGGAIMRHAVKVAYTWEMPELEEWAAFAKTQFPSSIFTRVDLNYFAFFAAHKQEEWEKAIAYGEEYRKGLRLLRAEKQGKKLTTELGVSGINNGTPAAEVAVLLGLANAYHQNKQPEKALDILSSIQSETLTPQQIRSVLVLLCQIHAESTLEVAPALTDFYEKIVQETSDEKKRTARLAVFNTVATIPFGESYRLEETEHAGYWRPAYTLFTALAEECEVGRAAKIMQMDDPAEMRAWLLHVEDWQALPIEALGRALEAGVPFPLPEKPLNQETMSGLATLLTHGENMAWHMTLALPEAQEYADLQSLLWTQNVALAALRSFDWSLGKKDEPASVFFCPEKPKDDGKPKLPDQRPECTPEIGLAFVRRFAALESAVLPLLYTPALLTEENAALLPPMHRWGFYCTLALGALDAGSPQEYLAALRRGLKACPGEKNMVQFLLDRFLEDARPKASPELLALAEKVRAILDAYSPEDPAAKAIRESDAYQQVAWLIEAAPTVPVQ